MAHDNWHQRAEVMAPDGTRGAVEDSTNYAFSERLSGWSWGIHPPLIGDLWRGGRQILAMEELEMEVGYPMGSKVGMVVGSSEIRLE